MSMPISLYLLWLDALGLFACRIDCLNSKIGNCAVYVCAFEPSVLEPLVEYPRLLPRVHLSPREMSLLMYLRPDDICGRASAADIFAHHWRHFCVVYELLL